MTLKKAPDLKHIFNLEPQNLSYIKVSLFLHITKSLGSTQLISTVQSELLYWTKELNQLHWNLLIITWPQMSCFLQTNWMTVWICSISHFEHEQLCRMKKTAQKFSVWEQNQSLKWEISPWEIQTGSDCLLDSYTHRARKTQDCLLQLSCVTLTGWSDCVYW